MPVPAKFSRCIFRVLAAALTVGILVSCATKKAGSGATSAPIAKTKKSKPTPTPKASPTPQPTPKPSPTPQARYVARVSVEGGETTQEVLTPDGQPTPTPTPAASPSPSPAAAPSPTPKPSPLNFITAPIAGVWQKVFPPKPTPAPTPGETGRVSFRVSTSDDPAPPASELDGEGGTAPMPAPTPIQIKLRPTEGFWSRMWHKVIPKKEEPPVAATPQWIGTIKLVVERDGYALIDSQGFFAAPNGETLNSVGADSESGVLRVTGDRNPPFFIADIVSGKPRAGDRVYSPKP